MMCLMRIASSVGESAKILISDSLCIAGVLLVRNVKRSDQDSLRTAGVLLFRNVERSDQESLCTAGVLLLQDVGDVRLFML